MKRYIVILGVVVLSGSNIMIASEDEAKIKEGVKVLYISQEPVGNLDLEQFGEKMLNGGLNKGEVEQVKLSDLERVMDWIQENMYAGVTGFYSNNQFTRMAKDLSQKGVVKLEFAKISVGEEPEPVEYISKIKILDLQKVKDYLQHFNDKIAEHNKKYPYKDSE